MSIEFVEPIDARKLINTLLSAYSDELIAAYYYTLTAYAIQDPLSEVVTEHFLKEVEEVPGKHAKILVDRLQDLEVHPLRYLPTIWDLLSCGYSKLSETLSI